MITSDNVQIYRFLTSREGRRRVVLLLYALRGPGPRWKAEPKRG